VTVALLFFYAVSKAILFSLPPSQADLVGFTVDCDGSFGIAGAIAVIQDRIGSAFGLDQNRTMGDETAADLLPERTGDFPGIGQTNPVNTGGYPVYVPLVIPGIPSGIKSFHKGTGTTDLPGDHLALGCGDLPAFQQDREIMQALIFPFLPGAFVACFARCRLSTSCLRCSRASS